MDAVTAAKRLLGCEFERTLDGRTARLRIVETEAYDQTDAASHSYNGRTARVDVMFGPAARLYVYFTYGMHYCCNVVVGEEGFGAGVLIRAAEPMEGEAVLRSFRDKPGVELSNGPAKLCQAMQVDRRMNGHDLTEAPLKLILRSRLEEERITITNRIGISKAIHEPWRFYIKDSSYVSKR